MKKRVAFLLLAAAVVTALTVMYASRPGDFAGYLAVGQLGLTGGDIYRNAPPGINTWPPFFGLACIPLAVLAKFSVVGTRVFWLLLNWVALALALAASIWLVYGRRLLLIRTSRTSGEGIDIASVAALLPLLLCIRWILANFEHVQVNIIILALVLTGLVYHRAGRDGRAGVLIGAAAALKVLPVLFIPYFFWRRQWRAMTWMAAWTLAWSLLPAAIYGSKKYLDQLDAWGDVFRAGWGVGKMNLSVYAMLDRTIAHHIIPFTIPGTDTLPASGSMTVRIAMYAALGLVAALACWFFRGEYEPWSRAAVAEWSVVLLVGAVFGPLTWKPYLVVLLLPMTLFVATWRDASVAPAFRRRLRLVTWLAFALGMAAANVLVGNAFAERLEMGSLLTVSALIVLAALYWYRATIPRLCRSP